MSEVEGRGAVGDRRREWRVGRLDSGSRRLEPGGSTYGQCDWCTQTGSVRGKVDRVWPTGTRARWPFSVDGDVDRLVRQRLRDIGKKLARHQNSARGGHLGRDFDLSGDLVVES
mgnify:CR=1 FL=1